MEYFVGLFLVRNKMVSLQIATTFGTRRTDNTLFANYDEICSHILTMKSRKSNKFTRSCSSVLRLERGVEFGRPFEWLKLSFVIKLLPTSNLCTSVRERRRTSNHDCSTTKLDIIFNCVAIRSITITLVSAALH